MKEEEEEEEDAAAVLPQFFPLHVILGDQRLHSIAELSL